MTFQTIEEDKLTKVKNPGKVEEKAVGDKGKKDKAKKEAKKAKKDSQKGDKKDKDSKK